MTQPAATQTGPSSAPQPPTSPPATAAPGAQAAAEAATRNTAATGSGTSGATQTGASAQADAASPAAGSETVVARATSSAPKGPARWKALDKDLKRISLLEQATTFVARPLVAPGIALAFMVLVGAAALGFTGIQAGTFVVVVATVVGAYMALNIGANDVANNMGPAVGANALSLGSALIIAAVFETAGAMLAGGDVVNTIASGIVSPELVQNSNIFVLLMMAALLAAALWLNLATYIGAPVSTTHAVVGGVVGAGVMAAGAGSVHWSSMLGITASWVISPVMGGVIAAALLAFIKARILYTDDKLAAARYWLPILIGFMAGTFATYLALKGLSSVTSIGPFTSLLAGIVVGLASWKLSVPVVRRQSTGLENRKKSVRKLFAVPLVCSAALLSFAHGANDVANAVGPLAAIVHAVESGEVGGDVGIPFWVMAIGAPDAVRAQAHPPGGQRNHQAQPHARLLCGALGGADRHHRLVAGPAGEFHTHRRGRHLRRGLLPRMVCRAPVPRTGRAAEPQGPTARRAQTAPAGAALAFHHHGGRLGGDSAHCRGAGGAAVPHSAAVHGVRGGRAAAVRQCTIAEEAEREAKGAENY